MGCSKMWAKMRIKSVVITARAAPSKLWINRGERPGVSVAVRTLPQAVKSHRTRDSKRSRLAQFSCAEVFCDPSRDSSKLERSGTVSLNLALICVASLISVDGIPAIAFGRYYFFKHPHNVNTLVHFLKCVLPMTSKHPCASCRTTLWFLIAIAHLMTCSIGLCSDQERDVVIIEGAKYYLLDWPMRFYDEDLPKFDVESTSN